MSSGPSVQYVNAAAISHYLNIREKDKNYLLTTKKGVVRLENRADIKCWTLFKANFGYGPASFAKVAKTLNKIDIVLDNDYQLAFNKFIDSYNERQCLSGKHAEHLGALHNKYENYSVEQLLKECSKIFNKLKENETYLKKFPLLCDKLSEKVESLEGDNKDILNQIIVFKNHVRAYCLPNLRGNALKCDSENKKLHKPLTDENAKILKASLKNLRGKVLSKHFSKRIEINRRELNLLKTSLKTKLGLLEFIVKESEWSSMKTELGFLKKQLDRFEKKLDQGKPISIPKWYHTTYTDEVLKAILSNEIRYDNKNNGGAFIANYAVPGYGVCGIAMGAHIEKTATSDPLDGHVIPTYAQNDGIASVLYSDKEEPYNDLPTPEIWLGMQRGKDAYINRDGDNDPNRIGIPIHAEARVQLGLEYYDDTTISHIFTREDPCDDFSHPDLNPSTIANVYCLGLALRLQVFNQGQMLALRNLIDLTFSLTLPEDWINMKKSSVLKVNEIKV